MCNVHIFDHKTKHIHRYSFLTLSTGSEQRFEKFCLKADAECWAVSKLDFVAQADDSQLPS